MTIGPIQIRWTKTVKAEHVMILALRGTVKQQRYRIAILEDAMTHEKLTKQPFQRAKTPKGAGASL